MARLERILETAEAGWEREAERDRREMKRLRGEINDIHKLVLAVSKLLENRAS